MLRTVLRHGVGFGCALMLGCATARHSCQDCCATSGKTNACSASCSSGTCGGCQVAAKAPKDDIPLAFGHAEDYTWLAGELQYVHARSCWHLRYASQDEEDRYGGSVTLQGAESDLDSLKSGQLVRVDGVVLDPESKSPSPIYRVSHVRPTVAP